MLDTDLQHKIYEIISNKTEIEKGERILEVLGFSREVTVQEFFSLFPLIDNILNSKVMEDEQPLFSKEQKLSTLIDKGLKVVERKDFVFHEDFVVKGVFEEPEGKWATVVKDSIFLDSRQFLAQQTQIFFDRVLSVMDRESSKGDDSLIT